MKASRFASLLVVVALGFGCSGGSAPVANRDSGPDDTGTAGHARDARAHDSGTMGGTSNVAPVIVNSGPPKTGSFDVPFVSVTLCVPGTMNCRTIDSMSVDTGASGVRVMASALSAGLVLPEKKAADGHPLVECLTYSDGYVWGSVKLADVRIAGELAGSIPIQVIGDPAYPDVPRACSSTGVPEDTVASFGGYGTIGINQIIPDCGPYCAHTAPVHPAGYYSCAAGTCTPVAVPEAEQVGNPIASFATDNNGAVLEFPAVPAEGEKTLTGSLIFGIGTAANNALGSATVLTVDAYGNMTTVFHGATFGQSYIDCGTNYLSFSDSLIARCKPSSIGAGYYCPPKTLTLMAENRGLNGTTSNVSFTVANAGTLFQHASYTAFDDVAGPGDRVSFAWGFPFFIGRSVFVALDGAATPGGKGPYVAY